MWMCLHECLLTDFVSVKFLIYQTGVERDRSTFQFFWKSFMNEKAVGVLKILTLLNSSVSILIVIQQSFMNTHPKHQESPFHFNQTALVFRISSDDNQLNVLISNIAIGYWSLYPFSQPINSTNMHPPESPSVCMDHPPSSKQTKPNMATTWCGCSQTVLKPHRVFYLIVNSRFFSVAMH